MLKIKFFIFFICVVFSLSARADLVASVDNLQIPYGETFEFRLTYDGTDGGLRPDFSVLGNEFNIYSTSSSVNSQFINGVVSQKTEWILTLLPKNYGKITIPAISAGKYTSQPIDIEVLSADKIIKKQKSSNDADTGQMAVFSADFDTENKSPYVGQGIAAVLTIHDNRNLQLSREPYFENENDWVIKRTGNPQTTNKNGENITEINYIIYPQKSGITNLPRAVVEGYYVVYKKSSQRAFGSGWLDLFDMGGMLGEQKPVLFKSEAKTINVLPIPEEFKGKSWVPAEILVATAKWTDNNLEFKLGETVAREIVITASGIDESQLPEIEFEDVPDWKQYPDKPQYDSGVHEGKLISQEMVRVVYIPQKSGKLRLPEIRIPWFNVTTQKTETAVIESEEINVIPNKEYETITADNQEEIKSQTQEKNTASETTKNNKTENIWFSENYIVLMMTVAAFLSGLLISFLFFGRKKRTIKEISDNEICKNIKKSLSEKDYRNVRDNLLHWGQTVYEGEKINNLKELATIIGDDDFTAQCDLLNAILYADSDAIPDKNIIMNALKKSARNKVNKTEKPLPNLYK